MCPQSERASRSSSSTARTWPASTHICEGMDATIPTRSSRSATGAKAVRRSSGRFNCGGRDPGWKDVLGFRGSRDVEKPAGEWNRMEVLCDGDSITTILNGYVVNIGTKSSLTKGKILFQSEGAEIFFRKIE